MERVSISERLQQLMRERGLKQADILRACGPLCEASGIKLERHELSQYVSGRVLNPGQKKLAVLSRALDVNEVWLMGYDVPREPDAIKTADTNTVFETVRSEESTGQEGSTADSGTLFFDYLETLGYQVSDSPNDDRWYIRLTECGRRIFLSRSEMERIEDTTRENIDLRITNLLNDGLHDA